MKLHNTQLSPEDDKRLWVETRLGKLPRRGRTRQVLADRKARRLRLEAQYDRLTRHEPPDVYRYGHRLDERASILFAR